MFLFQSYVLHTIGKASVQPNSSQKIKIISTKNIKPSLSIISGSNVNTVSMLDSREPLLKKMSIIPKVEPEIVNKVVNRDVELIYL